MDLDGSTWTCEACTFVNESFLDSCDVCGTPKGLPPIASHGADGEDAGYAATLLNWNEVRRLVVQDNRILYVEASKALEDAAKHFEKAEAQTFMQQVSEKIISIFLDQDKVGAQYLENFPKAFESYTRYYSEIAGKLADNLVATTSGSAQPAGSASSSASSSAAATSVVPANPNASLDNLCEGVAKLTNESQGFYRPDKKNVSDTHE
jgi:hypothetical protein